MQHTVSLEALSLELPHSLRYRLAKRLFDAALAALILLALLPILAFCAFVVRRSSPGPILFRQRRVGAQGREFTCLKFRTMRADADPALHRAYAAEFITGQAARRGGDAPVYKLVGDPRITPAGHWLRRTSLDELPQLWNLLRGEMSLVGPRPPIPYEVACYRPEHLRRLAAKPGITGLWQVSGRSSTTFEEMVALDLAYIESASFLFDLRILFRTIPAVFGRQGAH